MDIKGLLMFLAFFAGCAFVQLGGTMKIKMLIDIMRGKYEKYLALKIVDAESIKRLCQSSSIFNAHIVIRKPFYHIYSRDTVLQFISTHKEELDELMSLSQARRSLDNAAMGVALVEFPEGDHPAYKALNFFIDESETLCFIDVKLARIYTKPDAWKIYFVLI